MIYKLYSKTVDAMEVGASDCIVKSFTDDKINTCISSILIVSVCQLR